MSFNDVLKSNFLDNVTSVSLIDMAISLVLAFGLGMFIFLVYKKTYSGVMYSSSFGTTLVALTMITTVVILAVTSNVVLSLGISGVVLGNDVFSLSGTALALVAGVILNLILRDKK